MNLVAKYAGRVVQVKKDIDNYSKGDILNVEKLELKDNYVVFTLEDKPQLKINIPQGINNIDHWLSKKFKMLY